MNVPQQRIVIVGATGMVGGEALKLCLAHPAVAQVTVVGRRSVGVKDPKLVEVLHPDFGDCSALAQALTNQDAALFCLGAYTGSVPDDLFKKITVDYAVEFAKVLKAKSPQATFCLLSGAGADPSEKSRIAFARYKGMAENALQKMNFGRVHLLRPAYIYPVEPRQEPNFTYRLSRWLYPVLKRLMPGSVITSVELAQGLVTAALDGTGPHTDPVLENTEIKALLK